MASQSERPGSLALGDGNTVQRPTLTSRGFAEPGSSLSLGFTGVEGTSEGRRLGIRHPKIEGQRENNGKRSRQSHTASVKGEERQTGQGGRGEERKRAET